MALVGLGTGRLIDPSVLEQVANCPNLDYQPEHRGANK